MIVNIYKNKGPTSADVVRQIKKLVGSEKVGHAGTLDPLAKGVLIIGIGRESTKKLNEIVGQEKEYLATIFLGATSATDDAEGPVIKKPAVKKQSLNQIKKIIQQFIGEIEQMPPHYSAVKINGKEAYKLARKGQLDKLKLLKPRTVQIKNIKIISYKWPYLRLKVTTGPGVYIRSLARDIGTKLNTGGYLTNLERTRVGNFTKEKSLRLNKNKIDRLIAKSIHR